MGEGDAVRFRDADNTTHAFPSALHLNDEETGMGTIEVASDECDSCGEEAHVKAFLFAEMPSGRTLAYCGSHGTRYLDGLINQGARIVDMRHLIGT